MSPAEAREVMQRLFRENKKADEAARVLLAGHVQACLAADYSPESAGAMRVALALADSFFGEHTSNAAGLRLMGVGATKNKGA